MRLIDAVALMKTLGITDMDCEKCEWGEYNHCIRGGDFKDACSAIEDAPTIEERKTGKWIHVRTEADGNALYECSECHKGEVHVPIVDVKYCWNCGARMEG